MKNFFIQFIQKNKIILYLSAALVFTSVPLSVFAAEESAQTNSSPSESTPAVPSNPNEPQSSVSSEAASSEAASSEASKPDSSNTESSVTVELPSQETSSSQAPSSEPPADTVITPLPEPSPLPTPSEQPDNTIQTDVIPMQATFYAATKTGLNVRSGPSTDHDKIGTLKYGQQITVTGKTADNWYQIQYSGGIGYVLADYVSDTPISIADTPDTPNPDTGINEIQPDDSQTSNTENADTPSVSDDLPSLEENPDEENDEIISTETEIIKTTKLFGAPVIIMLVAAIIGVIALIGYSLYSLFKKDNSVVNEYPESEYYEDDSEYYNEEYYEDTAYQDSDYTDDNDYEEEQYMENEYADDEYYENDYPESDDNRRN